MVPSHDSLSGIRMGFVLDEFLLAPPGVIRTKSWPGPPRPTLRRYEREHPDGSLCAPGASRIGLTDCILSFRYEDGLCLDEFLLATPGVIRTKSWPGPPRPTLRRKYEREPGWFPLMTLFPV